MQMEYFGYKDGNGECVHPSNNHDEIVFVFRIGDDLVEVCMHCVGRFLKERGKEVVNVIPMKVIR